MPLWGSSDAASNSTIFAAAQVKVTPNTANRDALFGNTTANATIAGVTVGQYGVDAAEIAAGGGSAAHTGWILRTSGQGGRAGRVQEEVLVAGGISSDAEDVAYPDFAIRVTTQPLSNTANTTAGATATFRVVARTVPTGGTLSYQWTYANGGTIATGANVGTTTTANLVVNSAVQTTNASFKVEISTTGGAVNVVSSNATLTITT
jgi:hypothetical protein